MSILKRVSSFIQQISETPKIKFPLVLMNSISVFLNFQMETIFLKPSFSWFHFPVAQEKIVARKVDVRVTNVFIVFLKLDLLLYVLSSSGSK